MNSIERKFVNRGIERGGILLLQRNDAIKFIEECQKQNVIILGIDGFFITEDLTQPSMEHSIDISNKTFTKSEYNMLTRFLQDKNSTMYFEIICKE